jgi:hypothetical protein
MNYRLSARQSRVLLISQTQEHSTPAHSDPLVQHQAALLIFEASTPFGQFPNLVRRREVQLPRQWRLRSASRNWHCQPLRSMKDMFTRCAMRDYKTSTWRRLEQAQWPCWPVFTDENDYIFHTC